MLLQGFHSSVLERGDQRKLTLSCSHLLNRQADGHSQSLKDAAAQVAALVVELQRNANREFTPVIGDAMAEVYDICTAEHGM